MLGDLLANTALPVISQVMGRAPVVGQIAPHMMRHGMPHCMRNIVLPGLDEETRRNFVRQVLQVLADYPESGLSREARETLRRVSEEV